MTDRETTPLPKSAPEPASPQPIDAREAGKKNRAHVGRPLGATGLPDAPPEPAPHEPNTLTLKTPKVGLPAESDSTAAFVLGSGSVPD